MTQHTRYTPQPRHDATMAERTVSVSYILLQKYMGRMQFNLEHGIQYIIKTILFRTIEFLHYLCISYKYVSCLTKIQSAGHE